MKLMHLILREIRFRKLNFGLSLLAIVVAVALFVVFVTTGESYRIETRKIQLGMGQNLRIIPKETRMDRYWAVGFSEFTMPEEYVHRFASLENFEYTHLTATLQQAVEVDGTRLILTGILPEVMPPDRNQPPIMFSVHSGEVYLGSEAARLFQVEEGEQLDVLGEHFTVTRRLAPTGSSDDVRIFAHLENVQRLLNLSGRINEIRALECLCLIESGQTELDALALAEAQLAEILPEGKVILLKGIADVRERQRATMEGFLGLLVPIVILAGAILVGVLAMLNVRERFDEVGLLRAVGYGSSRIAGLFLGRAILLGLIGAPLGFAVGSFIALEYGPEIFSLTAGATRLHLSWLFWLAVLTPLFAALAAFVPTVVAVVQDPIACLEEG